MNCQLQLLERRFSDQQFMWFGVSFPSEGGIDLDVKTEEARMLLLENVPENTNIELIKLKNRCVTWAYGDSVRDGWEQIVLELGKTNFEATISTDVAVKKFSKPDGTAYVSCLKIECEELNEIFDRLSDGENPLIRKTNETECKQLHLTLARCFIKNI